MDLRCCDTVLCKTREKSGVWDADVDNAHSPLHLDYNS